MKHLQWKQEDFIPFKNEVQIEGCENQCRMADGSEWAYNCTHHMRVDSETLLHIASNFESIAAMTDGVNRLVATRYQQWRTWKAAFNAWVEAGFYPVVTDEEFEEARQRMLAFAESLENDKQTG